MVGTAAGLLWLLALAAGLPAQQGEPTAGASVAQQLAAVDQQLAASEQLSQLLEQAVQRVLNGRSAAADSGQLERLQHRLDVLELRLTTLTAGQCETRQLPPTAACRKGKAVSGQETEPEQESVSEPEPEPQPQPELEPEPELGLGPGPEPEPEPCDKFPRPLPAGQAPYRQSAVLACALSCLQLRDQGGSPQDGVYWFTGMPVPVFCDFSHDGGGWTLLLTARSRDGWNLLSVRSRRERSPSLDDNYSILRHADAVRDLGNGSRFAYRIETQAEKSRQRWGGIWLAPRNYSFIAEEPSQTKVACVRKFDKWNYKTNGVRKRMPWLNMYQRDTASSATVLTTGDGPVPNGWGSLLYDEGTTAYHHSPWSHPEAVQFWQGSVLGERGNAVMKF